MKYSNIREEELKNKVGQDFFAGFDTSEIIGNIDFCVKPKQSDLFSSITAPLLRAEAKTGDYDISEMFTQLILTIGKARTFEKTLPPAFLGAFDFKKIAFVEYTRIQDIFYENDFDWTITPSNHDTKEFKKVYKKIETILKRGTYTFVYENDTDKLKNFIKDNLKASKTNAKVKINKNNFLRIYNKRVEYVKPQIDVNWDNLKKNGILDADFFLADLFVDDRGTVIINDDKSINNDLFVTFEDSGYKISKENLNGMFDAIIKIKNKKQYELFRKNYKRPPAKEYQEYIILRRDLLVPLDIRERKGAFFTPRIWVEKSQEYMANYFGDNYQDEYYIWDCCAGTGNLLAGLTNKYNIYASTLDNADVIVMKDMIKNKTINLLENHVFQFDFLNGKFSDLPQSLQDIINNEEKRKKLIVYINPPYAEAGNTKQRTGTGKNKSGTTIENKTYEKYKSEIGKASNELFAQFLIRIYKEIPGCKIGQFSTLKHLQGANFKDFRENFQPKLENLFLVPGNTFDNVNGQFPIGFFIRNGEIKEIFEKIEADVYDKNGNFYGEKLVCFSENFINKRITTHKTPGNHNIGFLITDVGDFQNQNQVYLTDNPNNVKGHKIIIQVNENNILQIICYLAARQCIEATRLNDRDQFLQPRDERESDIEFQNDCLAFTLFHSQNKITSRETGVNHRIPFTESEVNARDKFASHFMTDFLKGREFSPEAKDVFEAGKKLWTYYHENCSNSDYLANASLYEIREYFQGRNDKGKMNNKSDDEKYNELIGNLREKLKILGDKIAEKVYEYEFLKR